MQRIKRLFYLTIFNILVSATTVLAMLYWWDTAKLDRSEDQLIDDSQPHVTVVVVNAAIEGTAIMETLGAPVAATETIDPATATPGSFLYQVQEGDTLGTIAGQFGVSLYDILAINDLQDPNNLTIGQQILVPTGALPTLTPTFTPTSTANPSSTPTPWGMLPPTASPSPTLQASVVSIASILGIGDLSAENVSVTLSGGSELSLTGWKLVDEDNHTFIFPQLELFPDGRIQINTRSGTNTATELFWGLAAAIWEPGETCQLVDVSGKVQATFEVP